MLTKPPVASRRYASKAYLALTGEDALPHRRCAGEAAFVALQALDPVTTEIGSLPINALAIALALAAGFRDPNCHLA